MPKANFKGEPFLSRYNLELNKISSFGETMDIINMCERKLTIYEASKSLDIPIDQFLDVISPFVECGLIHYAPVEL